MDHTECPFTKSLTDLGIVKFPDVNFLSTKMIKKNMI